MQINNLMNTFSALLTPTIAIFGVYIAFQQWQTNKEKIRNELFELRYEHIYKFSIDFYTKAYNLIHNKKNDAIQDLAFEYEDKLGKYRFLIKETDYLDITNIFSKFLDDLNQYLSNEGSNEEELNSRRKFELNYYSYEKKLYGILEKYLRIERQFAFLSKFKKQWLDFCYNLPYDMYFLFPTFFTIFSKTKKKLPKNLKFKISSFIRKLLYKKIL